MLTFWTHMRTLFWNVRGSCLPSKHHLIRNTIDSSSCGIVCLHETKLGHINNKLLTSICRIRFENFQVLEANGSSGGLLTTWDPNEVEGTPLHFGNYSISTIFWSCHSDISFVITNVYGPHTDDGRKFFWTNLEAISSFIQDPWAIMGDFNAVRFSSDKTRALASKKIGALASNKRCNSFYCDQSPRRLLAENEHL